MKKRNLLILIMCMCSMFILSFFIVTQISHSKEKQENQTITTSHDISDVEQIRKEVAYVQTLEVPEIVTYFERISNERGAAYAYQILRELPPSNLDWYIHLFGHVIGDELYNQQGTNGLEICTSEFSFACYHSVLARAIDEQGLGEIHEINQMCLELENGGKCQHGIGHGILVATGYEEPLTGLAVCETLEKQGHVRGCLEGVIMEFNLRSLENVTESTRRDVDERGYHYPCNDVVDKYKSVCYLEQTLWWRELFGKTNYTAIESLCAEIENEENKSWCYRGIGRLIPDEIPMDPLDTMTAECIAMTSNVQGQAWCLQMLREKTGNDGSICELLNDEYESTCRSPIVDMLI